MQTVNDMLTMYGGAASQHALRTTFVPREEAINLDKEIVSYWSQLASREVTSPLFHLPLRMGGLGGGLRGTPTRRSAMDSLAIHHPHPHGMTMMTMTHSDKVFTRGSTLPYGRE